MNYDCVVIGGGPAGLQLAYCLQQAGRKYVVLEAADEPGEFFRTYPRGRELISFNKVHSIYQDPETRLRWDWNSLMTDNYGFPFSAFSERMYPLATDLQAYLLAFMKEYGLNVQVNSRVVEVSRQPSGSFHIVMDTGAVLHCQYLVVATGVSLPNIPAIKGIEHAEGYESASLNSADYRGAKVLVLGKGNSAFEVADCAVETAALVHVASPTPITLAWQTRHSGHVRANNIRLLDMYQLKLLHGSLDCRIRELRKTPDGIEVTVEYAHADGEQEIILYDRVVRCTGFRFDNSIFAADSSPDLVHDDRFPALRGMWESTNVPDMFFAGTLMQAIDFRQAASTFIHGFRYNVRTLARYLGHRYHGDALAVGESATGPAELAALLLERASRTSALWSQFAFLHDVYVIRRDESGDRVIIYQEQPVTYVTEGAYADEEHYYTLTLEWGQCEGNVFAVQRHPRNNMAYTNVFLHPILRRYCRGELVAEHHVLEDLMGNYWGAAESATVVSRSGRPIERYHVEEHRVPLEKFLAEQF